MSDPMHLPAFIEEHLGIPRSRARMLIAQGKVEVNGVEAVNVDYTPAEPVKSLTIDGREVRVTFERG